MEDVSLKFNYLSIKLLDIYPSIDEISKNSEELLIIFQGNNSFFDLRELFTLKKEIIIKIGKNKKTIIISLIKSDILLAKSKYDIRMGEQWITFNYENKEKKPLSFASSLVDCIKIKILCKSLNKDNNEFIVKKNSLNSLNNKNISQKMNKNKFNRFSPMKFLDPMNINNDSNRLKTSFSYIPNKEYSKYYSVLTENVKGVFHPSQVELNEQKVFSTINKNDTHKMNFLVSSRTKNNSQEKNKNAISLNDNSNNNIKGTDDDKKRLNLFLKENSTISLNQNLKKNLGNIFISNGQLYQKEKEFYNDLDIKNYKKSMEKNDMNSPKSKNAGTPINSKTYNKDNINTKKKSLDKNINEEKEDLNFFKIMSIQNQENKSEKENEKNNSSNDLSEEYYEINNFYKLKEDFLLLYNDDYNNNIKDDLLKLELELFIEKVSELIITYHNNIYEKILENEILKNKYKANISEYLLIKKLYSKLNEIKTTKKSKIKSQLKNNNKFNDILNKDEMNLFKLIFPPLSEENLCLINKKEKLKQILDIVLNKNENIKLLDQNISLVNKINFNNSKSKNNDNDDKIIYKKKAFISKK